MCGICGIISKNGRVVPREIVVSMTRRMSHRGPDDEGFFFGDNAAFGHRRLSIIDLSAGHQPVFNEDKTISVVFNGEIYNFEEITETLKGSGHRFSTRSDTEAIVHAYEEWGRDCVTRFRGMFAFAIYDSRKDASFIARDRLGKKPLYYYDGDDAFVFASEIKPIISTPYITAEVNEAAVDFFLSLNYVPAPMTLFKDVYKLAPGGYVWIQGGKVEKGSYWRIEDSVEKWVSGVPEAQERLKGLLLESVRLRMISDVPVGVFLSGGLDSSLVTAVMSRFSSAPVKTYSVGYREREESELHFARIASRHIGTDHHEYILTHEDFLGSMEVLLAHLEEPLGEYAPLALYRLSVLAKRDVTVMLSGEGSDEVLGGYPLYHKAGRLKMMGALSPLLDSRASRYLSGALPEKFVKYADWIREPFPKGYHGVSCDITSSIRGRMYTQGFLEASGQRLKGFFEDYQEGIKGFSLLTQMQLIDARFWLPDHLLMRADKMTMAASIELRTPFLDHRLVEFSLGLPDDLKVRGGVQKFLLKKVAEEFLPASIIHREKKGFPLPVARWFREGLHGTISDILLGPDSHIQRYIRPEYLKAMLERHRSSSGDFTSQIFKAVALELWFRLFMGKKTGVFC